MIQKSVEEEGKISISQRGQDRGQQLDIGSFEQISARKKREKQPKIFVSLSLIEELKTLDVFIYHCHGVRRFFRCKVLGSLSSSIMHDREFAKVFI